MPKYAIVVDVDCELSSHDQESLWLMWRDGIEEWAEKGLLPAKTIDLVRWEEVPE